MQTGMGKRRTATRQEETGQGGLQFLCFRILYLHLKQEFLAQTTINFSAVQ